MVGMDWRLLATPQKYDDDDSQATAIDSDDLATVDDFMEANANGDSENEVSGNGDHATVKGDSRSKTPKTLKAHIRTSRATCSEEPTSECVSAGSSAGFSTTWTCKACTFLNEISRVDCAMYVRSVRLRLDVFTNWLFKLKPVVGARAEQFSARGPI